ncbi:MAG: hypothetical protein ACK4VY_10625 [Brevundimonas sp.]
MSYVFMDTVLKQRIHADFSNDYKLSATISEKMMTGYSVVKDGIKNQNGRIGFRYSSVFDKRGSYNTCFYADTAMETLRLLHVIEAVVIKAEGMHVDIEVLDTAYSFYDERIEWTGSSHRLPEMRGENQEVLVVSDGREWLAGVRGDVTTDAYLRNLLLE